MRLAASAPADMTLFATAGTHAYASTRPRKQYAYAEYAWLQPFALVLQSAGTATCVNVQATGSVVRNLAILMAVSHTLSGSRSEAAFDTACVSPLPALASNVLLRVTHTQERG